MPSIEIPKRALHQAQSNATIQCAQIKNKYGKPNGYNTWDGLTKLLAIDVPTTFSSRPCNYSTIIEFADFWAQSYKVRLEVAQEQSTAAKVKITTGDITKAQCTTFGSVTLYPEQEALFRRIYKDIFVDRISSAILQDGETGSGKSFIGAFLIAQHIADGALDTNKYPLRMLPNQYIIFTPKNVVEQYKRVLEAVGLGKYVRTRAIYVTSYSMLPTLEGRVLCAEEEDMVTDNTVMKWNGMSRPLCVIWDECQKLNNWKTYQTRAAQACAAQSKDTIHIFMSATPFEKVNDSYTVTRAIGRPLLGININSEQSFKAFASMVDPTDPAKPNQAALKRLREILGPYIYSLPRAKWPHKQLNSTLIIDFDSDKARATYERAYDDYLEVCKKTGKNTEFGEFAKFIALGKFRQASEPLRAPFLARKVIDNYRSGKVATVIGTAFKESIIRIAFALVEAGIPRDKIAIIWGGGKQVRQEDIMTQQEIDEILTAVSTGKGRTPTKRDFKRMQETLYYTQERLAYGETAEEQSYRHLKLSELRLTGTQSANQRQKEIDAFQSGSAVICLFTLASGGVGLSLDKDKSHLLPRECYFTPVWNGKEFKQALGRTVRRASLADSRQYVCFLRGTVEEHHVAPLLDTKLRCIAEITNRNFDVFDLLAREMPVEVTGQPELSLVNSSHKYMTEEEIIQAADSGHITLSEADEEDDEDED